MIQFAVTKMAGLVKLLLTLIVMMDRRFRMSLVGGMKTSMFGSHIQLHNVFMTKQTITETSSGWTPLSQLAQVFMVAE